jgi:hypothetical protein
MLRRRPPQQRSVSPSALSKQPMATAAGHKFTFAATPRGLSLAFSSDLHGNLQHYRQLFLIAVDARMLRVVYFFRESELYLMPCRQRWTRFW